jgi:lactate dehydrogenase-like 2-hydroxyacid dehydrogenase
MKPLVMVTRPVQREAIAKIENYCVVRVHQTDEPMPETWHSIGKGELALIKPTAFVINTTRGNILDEEALVEALQAGQLRGAGLDVFEHEPRVHPALLEMSNVVLLPHVGSATAETRQRMALLAAENLIAALKGQRPPNVVNPRVLA